MGFSRQEYWSGVPLPSPIHTYTHPKHLYIWHTHIHMLHTQYIYTYTECAIHTPHTTYIYTPHAHIHRATQAPHIQYTCVYTPHTYTYTHHTHTYHVHTACVHAHTPKNSHPHTAHIWCSTRGNPAFQGTLGVATREPSTVSHLTEHVTSLGTL